MADYAIPIKNSARVEYVQLVDQSNTNVFKTNPTIAAGDFQVSKDGGAFANLATLPVVAPAGSDTVQVALSAGEMNADNVVVRWKDAAGAQWCDGSLTIQTGPRGVGDLLYPTTSGRSLDVNSNGNAGIDWANVDAPTTAVGLSGTTIAVGSLATAAAVAAVQADTDNIQTRLPAALVGGRMDVSVGAMAADVMTAAAAAADFSAELAAALLDLAISGHTNAGTVGEKINAAGAAGDPWATDLPGSYAAGKAGYILASRATPGDSMALTSGERNAVADALLDRANGVETGLTPRQSFRLFAASLAGKLSGAATTTIVIRNYGDTKDRITATVDIDGNRTALSYDLT